VDSTTLMHRVQSIILSKFAYLEITSLKTEDKSVNENNARMKKVKGRVQVWQRRIESSVITRREGSE
jgi:hypothetical protein